MNKNNKKRRTIQDETEDKIVEDASEESEDVSTKSSDAGDVKRPNKNNPRKAPKLKISTITPTRNLDGTEIDKFMKEFDTIVPNPNDNDIAKCPTKLHNQLKNIERVKTSNHPKSRMQQPKPQ